LRKQHVLLRVDKVAITTCSRPKGLDAANPAGNLWCADPEPALRWCRA